MRMPMLALLAAVLVLAPTLAQGDRILISFDDELGATVGIQQETEDVASTGEDEPDDDEPDEDDVKDLFRVSDESGLTKVKEGDVSIADFMSNDVFIFENGKATYVWVGKGASFSEKKNGMAYAHKHLMDSTHPLVPLTVILEGQSNADFESALAA